MRYVEEHLPEGSSSKILSDCNLPPDHTFRYDRLFDDKDWQHFIESVIKHSGKDIEDVFVEFAEYFLIAAEKEFPVWFDRCKNSYDLIAKQPKIHSGFGSGINGKHQQGITEKFRLKHDTNSITTFYSSPNKLCKLYKALVQAAADLFNDEVIITEKKCMHDDDAFCEIHINWTKMTSS